MRTHERSSTNKLGRLFSGALIAGGLIAGSLVGGASAATAAPIGPCDRPEGIYTWSGDINAYAQNCRSTTVNLQLVIIDEGTVIHRDVCTAVAPGGTVQASGGVPTLTARWSWTYC